jgi:hypothetical protein
MKKYFLLFAAGGIITLASCGGETAPVQTLNVDSLAQVKADSMAAALKAESDAAIAAAAVASADSMMAIMKADSIAAAAAKAAGKKIAPKKVAKKGVSSINTTEPKVTPPPPPTQTVDPQKQRNNQVESITAPTNVEQQKKRNN